MRCPTLSELPHPPEGKKSWPWTEESQQLPDKMPDGSFWPKISIITPSLNQGRFIEETIRSVLLQGYPNLEYFIMDGGSKDQTLDILEKYSPWITYWESIPDKGQSHAIYKGFERATGSIYAYINSDDLYEPGAFKHVAELFSENPNVTCIAGGCRIFGSEHRIFKADWPDDLSELLRPFGSPAPQPSFFFSSKAYKLVGGFNTELHYIFDREFYIKLAISGYIPLLTSEILSR